MAAATTKTNEEDDMEDDYEHENSIVEITRQYSIHGALQRMQEKQEALWMTGKSNDLNMVIDSNCNASAVFSGGAEIQTDTTKD